MQGSDKALAALLERFGQSAPDLWAALVASERLEAIVFLVVFTAVIAFAVRALNRTECDEPAIKWIGGGFVAMLAAVMLSFLACTAATSLIYPEASALKALVQRAK